MKTIPVTILQKRRLFGIILTTLILPGIVVLLPEKVVVLLAIIVLFLLVINYISDKKRIKTNENVLQSRMPVLGVLLVLFGLLPLLLKPVLSFFQNLDLNQEIIGFLSSAVLSESLLRNSEFATYWQYLITGITHATLHSYYISLIAVIISLIACFTAVGFAIFCRINRQARKADEWGILQFTIQLIESVPGILLLCIFLPIVTKVIYKLNLLPETDLFVYVGITIGISCIPQMFRLVNNRIRQLEPSDFIINSKIHGVSESRIIWYHIIWKNSFHHILSELVYIWGFALILETGLCILASSGNLQLPMIGSLHFSLGYLISTEDSSKIFTLLFNFRVIHPLEFTKICFPFILFISITTGLFFIQQGFQNEKEDDIRIIPVENLANFDKILDKATHFLFFLSLLRNRKSFFFKRLKKDKNYVHKKDA